MSFHLSSSDSTLDPRFTFDFVVLDADDTGLDAASRWSTWLAVEPLCRGPEPRPD